MKNLLLLLFVAFTSIQIQAQQKNITGTIIDRDSLPLPSVNILVKETTNSTITDFNGNYTISAQVGDIIVYSYVGNTVEKTVGAESVISFTMPENAKEEVVVTLLGVKKKPNFKKLSTRRKNIGNTNTNVRTIKFSKPSNPNVVQSLSGKVSGLSINTTNNGINQSTRIVLRGNRSVTGTNEALIVVDGKITTAKELANINPKKIKSTNVIKGAGGSALYGSQGSNGVIIVQTKKGNYKLSKEVKAAIANKPKPKLITPEKAKDEYVEIVENSFQTVKTSPLSTFSIDVDKASYSNVRRMINNGQKVYPDAVKIEEMVNYFDYNYPQPKDNHPFSINTELIITPWNTQTKLVKIGLQGKTYNNEELPPSNLTFLIDVSGSMSAQNKLPLLKSAFKLLVNQLRAKDKVSIVVYAGAAGVVLEPTSGDNKKKILKALNNLQSGGSTAGGKGINLAYKLAEQHFKKNGNNRVILATDGDFNVGESSDKSMKKLIEEKRKSGVFLSVLGFGYGNYQDSKLEILADQGNGNHAYIDTMQEAQKVFGKEFGGTLYTIAKDVKIQVEFNPNIVQAYRLIGYENRLLEDEDFIDDTKDAGELGSGHTVTALYEVIPVGVQNEFLKNVSDLKYTNTETNNDFSDELLTVKFRYKKPEGKKSIEMVHIQKDEINEPSKDLKFASAVALFGMQLRASSYYNNTNSKDVIALAKSGRGEDEYGYRAEFIRLVKTLNK
ncbi:Ca-activated chloride channel family protein [Lacinutrix venerupis]|uniref:VWA domain-containing protein n=1 Tax=Lacinutrix venerupis TaxID=1486034 RepID=UPI000EAD222E|nr:VWA domain-containing protein [Lacinutrix venerupis]RLJ68742.1 Ca-activated chloride channel family protein [Lacinutrix venerupis]